MEALPPALLAVEVEGFPRQAQSEVDKPACPLPWRRCLLHLPHPVRGLALPSPEAQLVAPWQLVLGQVEFW